MALFDTAMERHGLGQITHKKINGVDCVVYVPENVNPDTSVSVYFPGGGGGGAGKGQSANNYVRDSNPNSIVIFPNGYGGNINKLSEGIINYANELTSHYGLKSNKYTSCSFSYGSVAQSGFLEYQLANHPETVPSVIGYIDSYKAGNYSDSGSNAFKGNNGDPSNLYKLLDKNDTTVMYFGRVGVDAIRKPFQEMMNAGVDFVYAKPNSGKTGHLGAEEAAMGINMVDFLNGNFESLLKSDSGYTFYKYDANSGTAPSSVSGLKQMTYDEVFNLLVKNGTISGLYNIDDLMEVDPFDIRTDPSRLTQKYASLLNIGDYGVRFPPGCDDKVVSSVTYVTDFVNGIRKQVRETDFLTKLQVQTFRSSDGIPGCIGRYVDAYFDMVGSLLSMVASESDAIMSIAASINNLDVSIGGKFLSSFEPSDPQGANVDNILGLPYYNQGDSRWGKYRYNQVGGNMAKSSCGFTSLAMVVAGLSGDGSVTPKTVIEDLRGIDLDKGELAKKQYAAAYNSELTDANYLSRYGITAENIKVADIEKNLNAGKPVIVLGKGHYVTLTKNEKGKIVLLDPFTGWGKNRVRSGEYDSVRSVMSQYGGARQAIAYSGGNGGTAASSNSGNSGNSVTVTLDGKQTQITQQQVIKADPVDLTKPIQLTTTTTKPTGTETAAKPTATTTTTGSTPVSTTPTVTTPISTTPTRTSPTTSTGQTRTTTSHPKPTVEELVGVGTQEFGEVVTRVDEQPEVTATVSEPINEIPTAPVSSPTPSVSPEPTPTYYEAPSNNSYDSDVPVYSDTEAVSTTNDYETEPVTNTTIIQEPVMDVNDVPTIDTQQVEEEPVISPEPVNESNNHTARNIGLATLGIAAAAGAGTVAYKALEKKKQNEGNDYEDNK